jgi:predicted DNA-binding protein YlxM (UPF0122 family)
MRTEHGYDVRVTDGRVRRLLARKRKPWWDERVLRHLHHELNMSLAEIGDIFGITRQSVHEAAQEIGVETERKTGPSKAVEKEQTRLSDYEREGLAAFV